MFRYNVRGENIEVTEAIRDYVEKKVGKLKCCFSGVPDATAHMNLKVYTEKTVKMEVTIPLPYLVLRAEEISLGLYVGIDLVVGKLERQTRKFKTKTNRKSRETGMNTADVTALFNEEGENENDSELDAVCTKRLSLKPMDSEEVVLQTNMLGHNFFILEDVGTSGTSTVYRREDGKCGPIETDWPALFK